MPYPFEREPVVQPFEMSQDQRDQLIKEYQTAKQRWAEAQSAYYQAAAVSTPSTYPTSGLAVPGVPKGGGSRVQYWQQLRDDAQAEVSRLERLNTWLKNPAFYNREGMRDYVFRVANQEGKSPEWVKSQLAKIGEQAAQPTTAELTPAQGTAELDFGALPGMTEEERLSARAQFLGMPTPEQARQQQWQEQWQQRLWQADLEQSASAEKRSQQQAQWAQQMDVYDSIRRNWEAKQQQAQFAQQQWQQVLPYALPQGVEYTPGFEPGGMMASDMARLGYSFNPEAFRGVPWAAPQGVGSAGAPPAMDTGTLQMILLQRAQLLGQGG